MATPTKEQRAKAEAPDVHFVAMTENGITLNVHPSRVQWRPSAGWKLPRLLNF